MDAAVSSAAYLQRNRRIDPSKLTGGEPVKLNLGSGLEIAPGWINVDASLNALIASWPSFVQAGLFRFSGYRKELNRDEYLQRLRSNRFVHADLTRPIPFADSSVDFIFSSHLLEHLTRLQAVGLLTEAYRVLRPTGTIRVAVPDLDVVIGLYAKGDARRMLDHYLYQPVFGRLTPHRYMYNFSLLEEVLEEAGFYNIQRRPYREGAVPDLGYLDNRPDETLFVEASRHGDGNNS
jgi:predicted SAM-dependent methyltransferase